MKALHILKYLSNGADLGMPSLSKINEAIKELEDLQNRKCSNCKYATLDSARYLPIHKFLMGCNKVNYDFSCSEWESK